LFDLQNPVDANAVALRGERNTVLLGYVPAFYAADLRDLLSRPAIADQARLRVVRCNVDAPTQLRLLCKFEAPMPADFQALHTPAHEIIFKQAA